MPGLEEVERYLRGILLLVRNRAEGLKAFDISVDGFWGSFWAIVYSVPAMAVAWAGYRLAYLRQVHGPAEAGPGFVLRLALVDTLTWIIPIVLLALVARPLGVSRHFVRYVVVTNWLALAVSYAVAVPVLLRLLVPGAAVAGALLSIAVFIGAIVALYRVTRLAFDGDGANAGIVTGGMVVVSMMTTGLLQKLLGVSIQ